MALHPATQNILRFFTYGRHLQEGPIRDMGVRFTEFAESLAAHCADEDLQDPEVTAGFRKLLEAKDCFVRAAVVEQQQKGQLPNG